MKNLLQKILITALTILITGPCWSKVHTFKLENFSYSMPDFEEWELLESGLVHNVKHLVAARNKERNKIIEIYSIVTAVNNFEDLQNYREGFLLGQNTGISKSDFLIVEEKNIQVDGWDADVIIFEGKNKEGTPLRVSRTVIVTYTLTYILVYTQIHPNQQSEQNLLSFNKGFKFLSPPNNTKAHRLKLSYEEGKKEGKKMGDFILKAFKIFVIVSVLLAGLLIGIYLLIRYRKKGMAKS